MASKKKLAIAAGAAAAILAVAGGGITLMGFGKDDVEFTQSDTMTVKKSDLESSITVSGSVNPQREISLSTSLTGPVSMLDAKVGQRVDKGQLLAKIDTSATKSELQAQRAAENAQDVSAFHQAEQARQQLQDLREQLDKGLHPGINAAESALRQAQEAYDGAQANANFAGGEDVAQARAALAQARNALLTANSQSLQAGLNTLSTADAPEAEGAATATALLGFVDASTAVDNAERQLRESEDTLNRTVAQRDKTAADNERAAQAAWGGLADAKKGLEAAQLAAQQQVRAQAQAADAAVDNAAASHASQEATLTKLEKDIQGADITAPVAGVITAVTAQEGQTPAGPILTVADDSVKMVRVTVKEADVAKIKVGDKATFTSPSAPDKKFDGTVDFISPVAEKSDKDTTKKAEFAVDIKAAGAAPELRLGASAKAKIITSLTKDVLSVPRSAIFEREGKSYVLVVNGQDVQEREVTVGETTDFYASITKGLKAGDTILKQASPRFTDKPGA